MFYHFRMSSKWLATARLKVGAGIRWAKPSRVHGDDLFLNQTCLIQLAQQRFIHLVQMTCSEAVIHPIERAVVRHARQFRRIAQLLAHQEQLLKVAVAHFEVKTQQHTRR